MCPFHALSDRSINRDPTNADCSIGVAAGSVYIDEYFQREVEKRLDLARCGGHNLQLGQDIAHDLTKTTFQHVKTSFGTAMQTEEIKFRIKGMPKDYSHAEAKIENGRIVFTQ